MENDAVIYRSLHTDELVVLPVDGLLKGDRIRVIFQDHFSMKNDGEPEWYTDHETKLDLIMMEGEVEAVSEHVLAISDFTVECNGKGGWNTDPGEDCSRFCIVRDAIVIIFVTRPLGRPDLSMRCPRKSDADEGGVEEDVGRQF